MALTPDGIHATRQLEAILYGERQQTEGKGTAILVHQSISITSWHIFSPRITAIIFPYGDKSIMRFSIYEPAIDRNGPRAAPFYHDLDKHVGETKATCSITLVAGDFNTSAHHSDSPEAIGNWASCPGSTSARAFHTLCEYSQRFHPRYFPAERMAGAVHIATRQYEDIDRQVRFPYVYERSRHRRGHYLQLGPE